MLPEGCATTYFSRKRHVTVPIAVVRNELAAEFGRRAPSRACPGWRTMGVRHRTWGGTARRLHIATPARPRLDVRVHRVAQQPFPRRGGHRPRSVDGTAGRAAPVRRAARGDRGSDPPRSDVPAPPGGGARRSRPPPVDRGSWLRPRRAPPPRRLAQSGWAGPIGRVRGRGVQPAPRPLTPPVGDPCGGGRRRRPRRGRREAPPLRGRRRRRGRSHRAPDGSVAGGRAGPGPGRAVASGRGPVGGVLGGRCVVGPPGTPARRAPGGDAHLPGRLANPLPQSPTGHGGAPISVRSEERR